MHTVVITYLTAYSRPLPCASCRNTWTPTNASTSSSSSSRRSGGTSEGKRSSGAPGQMFYCRGDISSCLQSIPEQRQQDNVVWFPARDKLCTLFLRNAFCVWKPTKKKKKSVRQRGGLGALSVRLTGGISHGGPLERICPDNGNEELMEMPI